LASPLIFWYGAHVPWSELEATHWWCIAYVIVGTTFLTYALNMVGVKFLNPTIVSAYIYLQPILAAIFTWLMASWFVENYSADLNFNTFIYSMIVIGGVYLASLETSPLSKFKSSR
jgi:drug/metabolite transporter (DMT)-like permease